MPLFLWYRYFQFWYLLVLIIDTCVFIAFAILKSWVEKPKEYEWPNSWPNLFKKDMFPSVLSHLIMPGITHTLLLLSLFILSVVTSSYLVIYIALFVQQQMEILVTIVTVNDSENRSFVSWFDSEFWLVEPRWKLLSNAYKHTPTLHIQYLGSLR